MKTAKTTNNFNRNLHYVKSLGLGYRIVEEDGFNRVSLLDAEGKLINTGLLTVNSNRNGKYYIGSPARARAFDAIVTLHHTDQITVIVCNNAANPSESNKELIGKDELRKALEEMALKYFELDGFERVEGVARGITVRGFLHTKFFDIYQKSVDKWIVGLNGRTVMFGSYSEDTTHSSLNKETYDSGMCRADNLNPQETALKLMAVALEVKREQLVTTKEQEIAHELLDAALSKEYFDMLTSDISTFDTVLYPSVAMLAEADPKYIHGAFPIYAPDNGLPQNVILDCADGRKHIAFTTNNWVLVPRRALADYDGQSVKGYVETLEHAVKCMSK